MKTKLFQQIKPLFLIIAMISSCSFLPVQAAPLSIKQKTHLALIGTLAASEYFALSQQESKTKGAKVNRLLRDAMRILNQCLMIKDHPETSLSSFIPFTYDIPNAWTHFTEFSAQSPEPNFFDEEKTSLNNTKNNTEQSEADRTTSARLKKLSKLLFPTIEIYTSGLIALNDGNSSDAQQKRLKLHAFASLSRTLAEWIESDSGSTKAKTTAVLLLANFVTALCDMDTIKEIEREKLRREQRQEEIRRQAEQRRQRAQQLEEEMRWQEEFHRRQEEIRRQAEEDFRRFQEEAAERQRQREAAAARQAENDRLRQEAREDLRRREEARQRQAQEEETRENLRRREEARQRQAQEETAREDLRRREEARQRQAQEETARRQQAENAWRRQRPEQATRETKTPEELRREEDAKQEAINDIFQREQQERNPVEAVHLAIANIGGNPYELLGIAQNASRVEINRAFRRLSQNTHPDHPGGNIVEQQRIVAARELLLNPVQRRIYDRQNP